MDSSKWDNKEDGSGYINLCMTPVSVGMYCMYLHVFRLNAMFLLDIREYVQFKAACYKIVSQRVLIILKMNYAIKVSIKVTKVIVAQLLSRDC